MHDPTNTGNEALRKFMHSLKRWCYLQKNQMFVSFLNLCLAGVQAGVYAIVLLIRIRTRI